MAFSNVRALASVEIGAGIGGLEAVDEIGAFDDGVAAAWLAGQSRAAALSNVRSSTENSCHPEERSNTTIGAGTEVPELGERSGATR